MNTQEQQKQDLLERTVNSLNASNEFLAKRQAELEAKLATQVQLCDRLKKRLRELSSQSRSVTGEHENMLRQLADLSQKINKVHEKIFNTTFTAGIVNHSVLEMMNSQSFVWTNFLRYVQRTLFSWSLQGKIHFLRTVSNRIFLNKKMQLPSALSGIDHELQLLTAALTEVCQETSTKDSVIYSLPQQSEYKVKKHSTTWDIIFASRMQRKNSDVVAVATVLFYDVNGKIYMNGGAERYLVELFGVCQSLGLKMEILQSGSSAWKREHKCEYGAIPVTAIPCEPTFPDMSKALDDYFVTNPYKGVIFSPFPLAQYCTVANSIGISHGIYWDNVFFHYNWQVMQTTQFNLISAVCNCKCLISVDANTINWLRTTCLTAAPEMHYIPNFVSKKEFYPAAERNRGKKTTVVYPRRLYAARGFDLVLEVFPKLLQEYPEMELQLIGQIDDSAKEQLSKFLKQYPDRVIQYCCPQDKMPEVYRQADIVLIPTCYSEGTSLSCLEAMASRCAIVATDIGGLPELIINGHNGLLIAPDGNELYEAVKHLMDDTELCQTLADNAQKTSACYEIEIWRNRWKKMLNVFRDDESMSRMKPEFVQLAAPGQTWSVMKQRPQQLFQALAENGFDATYISDEPQVSSLFTENLPEKLHVRPISYTPDINNKYLYIYFPDVIYHNENTYGELLRKALNYKIIFDILDVPEIHKDPTTGKVMQRFLNNFNFLLDHADIVIASSRLLVEKYQKRRPDIKLVLNGVNPQDFILSDAPKRPSDLPPPGKKIVGYYGALAEWFDYDLLFKTATELPDVEFVLIGLNANPKGVEKLTSLSNIHYLGQKSYEALAKYLWYFDVATIPFLVNEVTDAVSPIKLFEYCASGTPTVTTAFKEVKQYEKDGILVAADAKDYMQKICEAIRLSGENLKQCRVQLQKIADAHTWKNQAEVITEAIQSQMEKK